MPAIQPCRLSLRLHERVTPVLWDVQRALHGARADPSKQVERSSGLVVGPARPGATERLLGHHGAGWLVVDVEVPRREAKRVEGPLDVLLVVGEDGSGEGVRGPLVAGLQRPLEVFVLVDVDCQDRPEDLFLIKVLPQAIARGNIHKGIMAGKLKGVIPTHTPRGCM